MTSEDTRNARFTGNNRNRLAIFLILAVAVAAMMLSPAGSLFVGELSRVSAQEGPVPTEADNAGPAMAEEDGQYMDPTAAAVDMNSSKIVVSGTAASPGDEAGPFQILQILPERMDGKVYVGSISFTASAPIYVIPGFGFDANNQTLNHNEFGELIRFPSEASFANSPFAPAEIAHGPILPQYGPPAAIMTEGSLPNVYSATIPFTGDVLEVGDVNGTKFIISYTVIADVYDTTRVSALGPALLNTTGLGPVKNHVSIGYGAVERTNDAFSPNPIIISAGESITWTNDDFIPHTVTSGSPDQMGTEVAGLDFDSGFIGTRSSYTHTFDERGEFDYFCQIHPTMVGTVHVR